MFISNQIENIKISLFEAPQYVTLYWNVSENTEKNNEIKLQQDLLRFSGQVKKAANGPGP